MRRAIVLVLLLAALPAFGEKVHRSFQSSVPRGKVRRVVVDIPAGDVEVRNGAADSIAISGYVAREQGESDETTVEIYVSNDEAVVRRRGSSNWRSFNEYRLRLDVPPGTNIDLETRFGDATIEGRFGDIDVDLRAGDIDLRIPKKDVRELSASARVGTVRTKIGDDIVEREGVLPGETRYVNESGKSIVNVHATAGDVRVTLTK